MPKTKTTTAAIREETWGADPMRVDREAGVIYGVKCLGRESKNGRVYSDQALTDARDLYEGRDVNLDHADGERKMIDGFGVLRNAVLTREGVFADLHYLKSHPLADPIAERAEKFPKNFGMSHDASGVLVEGGASGGRDLIEGLDAVESVDIVRKPATNSGLFESEQGAPKVAKKRNDRTVAKVLASLPENEDAKIFSRLLEMEAMSDYADAPVEAMGDGASADDEVKSAFRAMVVAAFDDESLDTAATIGKIREILKAQEKLSAPSDPPASDGGGDESGDDSGDGSLGMEESVKRQIAALILREDRRETLEEASLKRSDLNESQRKLWDRASTREEMVELLESWKITKQPTSDRPAIGRRRRVEEGESGKSYEQLRDELRPKSRR